MPRYCQHLKSCASRSLGPALRLRPLVSNTLESRFKISKNIYELKDKLINGMQMVDRIPKDLSHRYPIYHLFHFF